MQKTFSFKLILLHLAAWVLVISLLLFTSWLYNPKFHFDIASTLLIYSQAALVFYGSSYLFFRFLPGTQYVKLFVTKLLFFGIICGVMGLCSYVVTPLVHGEKLKWPTGKSIWWFIVSTVFWLYLLLSVLSLGYYFARRTMLHQKELQAAEKRNAQAQQEKIEAEHAFLRAQINPHFLYNTLNFFYSKSLGCAPELSEGILILNDIMRYSLESGEDENGLVLLHNEVEHLQNVIQIHQLRFSNRLKVSLSVEGEMNAVRIVPLVLITLVENAFKHGDLTNEEYPTSLRLQIVTVPQRQLIFTSSNKKKKGPVETHSGIGLVNIQKRLEGAYGNQASFTINDEADFYTVTLQIQLP